MTHKCDGGSVSVRKPFSGMAVIGVYFVLGVLLSPLSPWDLFMMDTGGKSLS